MWCLTATGAIEPVFPPVTSDMTHGELPQRALRAKGCVIVATGPTAVDQDSLRDRIIMLSLYSSSLVGPSTPRRDWVGRGAVEFQPAWR